MTSSEKPVRRTLEFFSAKNLHELAPENEGPKQELSNTTCRDEDKAALMSAGKLMAQHIQNSAFSFEGCGLHIGVFEFAPGLPALLHSHPDDCVYYVERGSFLMGNREIGPGEGFLTRKNQPYSFVVGANGARIIEFTTGPRNHITIHDAHVAAWKERVEKAVAKLNAHDEAGKLRAGGITSIN